MPAAMLIERIPSPVIPLTRTVGVVVAALSTLIAPLPVPVTLRATFAAVKFTKLEPLIETG